jgi:hypothetical protein
MNYMKNITSYKTIVLDRQTELHDLLNDARQGELGLQLFFSQHAQLHSRRMAETEDVSYQDLILEGLGDSDYRGQPANCEHSVAWLLWHMTRCEDIAINMLISGSPQVLLGDDWNARLKIDQRDTGNLMQVQEMAEFNAAIVIEELLEYRIAVGRRTRSIVQNLKPQDLKRKVDPVSIQQVLAQGAVLAGAQGITDYWGKRTFSGLLLMPASRHLLTHLNEAASVVVCLTKSKNIK